ncbi:MAG: ABC transporter ATP-binding protein [Daejeonella sp.]
MNILLENIGRRFNREWIFKNINYTFEQGESYAVLGPNGSGKSTLLQIICGSLSPSVGTITHRLENKQIDVEQVFEHISLTASYLELIEEFTLEEIISFHFKFKSYRDGLNATTIIDLLGLQNASQKILKYFSSGMKQRVKLALAFCSNAPVLLLDEPTSNLDIQGVQWYLSLIEQFSVNRLVIICSNQEHEYGFCDHQLKLQDYKQ